MIPDYCVPDTLANTGASNWLYVTIALLCVAVGVGFVALRSAKKVAPVAAALALCLVAFSSLHATPSFASVNDAAAKPCPKGYHYDASKDVVKPYMRTTQPDESALKVKTEFTMAADGSTGRTASGEDIINWDIAKKTIRAYMNADKNGIANKTESPYITDVTSRTTKEAPIVAAKCAQALKEGKKPAAVFDADDTTLWTYDMEDGDMHFAFTPAKQDAYFAKHQLPATPGMVALVQELHKAGCTIIGLTGRNDLQKAYTIKNLTDVGYVDPATKAPLFTSDLYFTKFKKGKTPMPQYLKDQGRCDVAKEKCTTVQFKAGTRQHIEQDLGYTIVGNFGDQWSDLQGGYSEYSVKLPNATYYLPSPNIPEAEAADAAKGIGPEKEHTYQVLPDGSSGKRPGVKDTDIPNMDIVKATIRAYYNAHKAEDGLHVADREKSRYIDEMTALTKNATDHLNKVCAADASSPNKPAVVFDADDTTLWMYDMEEWLEFNFSPALQLQYLKTDYHSMPAVPGMVNMIHAAHKAGCTVIGLTGRSDELRDVTLRNLKEAGYTEFTPDLYFTKTSSHKDKLPSWVECKGEKCTAAEFKTSVRKHIEQTLGYHIVGNFGDQFSDLLGGYSDVNYKLPNPMYYLP